MSDLKTIPLIASFEYNSHLEIALTQIELLGIERQNIFAVPLQVRAAGPKIFDTIHRSDGLSLFDGGAVLGTIFMLFGAMYGFVLPWGPITWGLIGLFGGFAVGFAFDLLIGSNRKKRDGQRKISEVFLLIHCREDLVRDVETILWDHFCLGLSRVER